MPKRSTNRTVAAPAYHESRRKTNKNVTKTRLDIAGTAASMAESCVKHATEFFGTVARRFTADEKYGRQHYNQDGFIHPDGVLRLSNESLALAGTQILEVLSQRAAQTGNKAFAEQMGEGGDPAAAKKVIDGLRKFAADRPGQIKADAKAGIYGSVMKDLGIEDAAEIVPAAGSKKAAAKKPAAKKTSAKKTSAKKPAAKTAAASA